MDRRHRLTSSRDFARVMRSGKRASSGPVALAIVLTGEPRPARVGFTARLSTGGAVVRNRAKRLLREAARPKIAVLPQGADLVLSARSSITGSSFQDVEHAVRAALEKAGVAC